MDEIQAIAEFDELLADILNVKEESDARFIEFDLGES